MEPTARNVQPDESTAGPIGSKKRPLYPDVRFAVISDLHYYDASLGTSGQAFQEAAAVAETLISDSGGLLELAIDEILQAGVRFVLVPGDLTKDGEAASHVRLPSILQRLVENGIAVYVIPGNHDMNNPRAFRYAGEQRMLDAAVSPDEFARLYAPFGYGQALLRHDASLSYVAEPVAGLWLVAIDCTLSRFNRPDTEEIIGGRLSPELRVWLADVLRQASELDKAVVCMLHHGVVEHWRGQASLHPDFLVEDFTAVGRMLAAAGVRLAFTGHYHAQDITCGDFGSDGFIFDVETGSLTAWPCPIRFCTLRGNTAGFTSISLADRFRPGSDYRVHAIATVRRSVKHQALAAVRKYKVSARDADLLADYAASGFLAHYAGNENPADRPAFDTGRLGLWGRFIYSRQKSIIDSLWHDLPPADDDVTLDLDRQPMTTLARRQSRQPDSLPVSFGWCVPKQPWLF